VTSQDEHIKIDQVADIAKIEQHLEVLIGEVCSEAQFSYGDELVIHFGTMTPYPHPALSHLKEGQWALGTRGSEWIISSSSKTIVSTDNTLAKIKRKIRCVEGAKVAAFKIGFPEIDLTIEFSNGLNLQIIPVVDDIEEFPDVAHWEFFTADEKCISVWPDSTWTYTS
jgi:hypothetical protein